MRNFGGLRVKFSNSTRAAFKKTKLLTRYSFAKKCQRMMAAGKEFLKENDGYGFPIRISVILNSLTLNANVYDKELEFTMLRWHGNVHVKDMVEGRVDLMMMFVKKGSYCVIFYPKGKLSNIILKKMFAGRKKNTRYKQIVSGDKEIQDTTCPKGSWKGMFASKEALERLYKEIEES